MAPVSSHNLGGKTLRRLLLAVLLVLILFGLVTLWARQTELVDSTEGLWVLVIGTVSILTAFIVAVTISLERGDRQRAENAGRFRSLLEAAPDAIVIIGSDGRITLINHQTEKLFGYERDQLIGQAVEVLIPQRFRGRQERHREGFFADPRARPMGADLDLYGLRSDSTEFPVEISLPLKTETGMIVSAAIRDVTERRQVEDTLRGVVAIVDGTEDAIFGMTDGMITNWNPGAQRLFGYSEREILGQPIDLLHPPDYGEERKMIFETLGAGGHIKSLETQRRRKDDTLIDVSLAISPIRDRSGKLVGLSEVVRDISEEKQLREEAQRLKDEFLGSSRTISERQSHRSRGLQI